MSLRCLKQLVGPDSPIPLKDWMITTIDLPHSLLVRPLFRKFSSLLVGRGDVRRAHLELCNGVRYSGSRRLHLDLLVI
jgi:hypothetical protein